MVKRVDVTEQDIRCGCPGESNACPIQIALCRVFPARRVAVLGEVCIINGRCIRLPKECVAFVHAFDEKAAVPPFSFTIDTEAVAEGWTWE